jgi:hypothetical protein
VLKVRLNPGDGASEVAQHSLLAHLIAAHTIVSKPSTLEHASAAKGLSVHFCFGSQQSLTEHVLPGQTMESNPGFFTRLWSQNDSPDAVCKSKGKSAAFDSSSCGGDVERGTH